MTLYIGVDFHPHQQTAAWCDRGTGEIRTKDLVHDLEKVREFYRGFDGPAVVGVEASLRAGWFEKMVSETGHKLVVGNPVLIRKRAVSRHKSDHRDAELILELLMRDEFPANWRREAESEQVLEILRLRLNLVRQRTQVYNRLQAFAHNAGLPKGRIRTAVFQTLVKSVAADEAGLLSRNSLFAMLHAFSERIASLEAWLKAKAEADEKVRLLQTQRGAKTADARKLLVKLSIMPRDNITAAEFDQRGRTVGNARKTQGSAMTAL